MYGRIGNWRSAPNRILGQTGLGWGQYTQNALPIRSASGTSQLARPGVVPPLAGYVGVDLVGSSPGAGVAAPGAVVAEHQIASRPDRVVSGRVAGQRGKPRRVGK